MLHLVARTDITCCQASYIYISRFHNKFWHFTYFKLSVNTCH